MQERVRCIFMFSAHGLMFDIFVTGLGRPRWFQEVKVPRLRDNGTGWW